MEGSGEQREADKMQRNAGEIQRNTITLYGVIFLHLMQPTRYRSGVHAKRIQRRDAFRPSESEVEKRMKCSGKMQRKTQERCGNGG